MKIVVLDGKVANPGDLDWSFLYKYGEVTVYDRTPEELIVERAAGADICIVNKTPMSAKTVSKLPALKMIAVTATGYNIIDCDACDKRNIAVSNIPSYSVSAVAQQTFAFILEFANKIGVHDASVKNGDWTGCPDFSYQISPLTELAGKTLGIVGFGRIGRRVAELASAFEMKVIVNTAHKEKYTGYPYEFDDLPGLLSRSDIVTVHCPLTPDTEHMVNAGFLSMMKDGAFLVNTSRGGELDEKAVAEALSSGKLAGAGVDVLSVEPPEADNPLLSAPNIYITPHIAWAAKETRERLLGILEENISSFINGTPVNIVNNI